MQLQALTTTYTPPLPLRSAQRRLHAGWTWLIAALAMGVLWWSTLLTPLVKAWLTDGDHLGGLLPRLARQGVFYYGAPFIGVVAAALAVRAYRRHGLPACRSSLTTTLGWLGLILGLLVQLGCTRIRLSSVSGYTLPAVCVGLLLIAGGWSLVRAYWLVVAALLFLAPRPEVWFNPLLNRANHLTCALADRLVYAFFSFATFSDDRWVYLPDPTAAAPSGSLDITQLCATHQAVALLVFYALLFSVRPRLGWVARLSILPLTLAAALAGSVVHVAVAIWAAGPGESVALASSGWFDAAVTALAPAPAVAMPWVICRLSALWARRTAHRQQPPSRPPVPTPRLSRRPAEVSPLGLVLLSVAAALSLPLAATASQERCTSTFTWTMEPRSLSIQGRTWKGVMSPLPQFIRDILQTDDCVQSRYEDPASRFPMMITLAFSDGARNGMHPPEVCQKGTLVDREDLSIAIPGHAPVPMRGITDLIEGQTEYNLYTYFYPGAFTPSYSQEQAATLLTGMIHRTGGGLVSITVPIVNGDLDTARAIAEAAAVNVLPRIEKVLSTY